MQGRTQGAPGPKTHPRAGAREPAICTGMVDFVGGLGRFDWVLTYETHSGARPERFERKNKNQPLLQKESEVHQASF